MAYITDVLRWDGTKWAGWEKLGGVFTSSLAVASSGVNQLDVVGRGTDSALWHNLWDGRSWSGWKSLGGIFISEPSIVSWGPGRYDVFGIGTDGALYHKYFSGGSWSGSWENLGGVLISAPTAVSVCITPPNSHHFAGYLLTYTQWGANRLDIFALGTDNAVWHKWWNGSSWRGWERLG